MASKPVALGQVLRLSVNSVSHRGEGVGEAGGFTVFVPYTAPGDVAEVEVISVKPDYARALARRIIRPGNRVKPRCRWHGQCGGCSLQHLDYSIQLEQKTQAARATLQRIGGVDPGLVKGILPAEPWHYRNKLQNPVAYHSGQLTAGMYRPRSHDLVPVEDCAIQHPENTRLAQAAEHAARQAGVPPWQDNKGVLRHIVSRHSAATGQSLLVLVVSQLHFPQRDQLVGELKQLLPQLDSMVFNENPHITNVILGAREEVVWGPGHIIDQLNGLKFKISARSFWQVNTQAALAVYNKVREYASLSGRETVLDIYCGTGSIGLFLAQDAKEVIGIESNSKAVEDARHNAEMNNIHNARFHLGQAEKQLPRFVRQGLRADVIVLDPPRKGCAPPLLQAAADAAPQKIVYVSCNPATLARDLRLLAELGYGIREVQPVDMFPHTHHVECVVLMSRVKDQMC